MAAPATTHEELEKWGEAQVPLPRIAIKFCVQCKWNLRAAYYAQELLSTFSTALGEVSLIPATGGTFTITLLHRPLPPKDLTITTTTTTTTSYPGQTEPNPSAVTEVLLWDRKTDGGFPETKELKNRVRNVVEPGRDLGHVDRSLKKAAEAAATATATATASVAGAKAESPTRASESMTTGLKGSGGGGGGGGETANSTVQSDVETGTTDPTNQAKECKDCQ